ncbi:hypothetical protein KA977_05085, partial [Candidatus Dependentiae bacterium]|nr:hypothetical protein [Candidatus Dependentiae bacterium]
IIAIILMLFFKLNYFINSDHNGWDWFWQNISTQYLRMDLLKWIWYMHSQPPGHNLLFGIFIKLFYPNQYLMFQLFSIFTGALMMVLLYEIADYLIKSKLLKTVLIALIFFNPAVFLFENYLLYTLNTGFLVVLSVYWVMKYTVTFKNVYLYLLFATINILILYRSSFHIIFIPGLLLYTYIFITNRIRTIFICILISSLSFGWCLKNYLLYGFFGTSSWYGLNIYKFITTDFNQELRKKVLKQSDIPLLVSENNHFYTEDITKFSVYGFNKKSRHDFLNDNNFHNINIPDISKKHSEAAVKVIKIIPEHYFKNAVKAFILFNKPSYTYDHLESNKKKIKKFVIFYNNLVFPDNYILKKINGKDIYFFSGILYIISGIIIFYQIFFQFLVNIKHKKIYSPECILISFILFVLIFFTLISCFFEIGENNRFRFSIEPFIYLIFFYVIDDKINSKKWNF